MGVAETRYYYFFPQNISKLVFGKMVRQEILTDTGHLTVKTKNIFATPQDSDGERYLISRHYAARPKSMKKLCITKWIRDLGPSKELLFDYKYRGISQEEYTKRFNQEKNSDPKAQKALAGLRSKHNQGQTITLLCKCEEGEFCHRHLVKQMIIAGNQ